MISVQEVHVLLGRWWLALVLGSLTLHVPWAARFECSLVIMANICGDRQAKQNNQINRQIYLCSQNHRLHPSNKHLCLCLWKERCCMSSSKTRPVEASHRAPGESSPLFQGPYRRSAQRYCSLLIQWSNGSWKCFLFDVGSNDQETEQGFLWYVSKGSNSLCLSKAKGTRRPPPPRALCSTLANPEENTWLSGPGLCSACFFCFLATCPSHFPLLVVLKT